MNIEPKRQLVEQVLATLRNTPGVRAAAASFTSPLAGAPNRGPAIDGNPAHSGSQGPSADFQVITPDYFEALGMTLVRGRAFERATHRESPARRHRQPDVRGPLPARARSPAHTVAFGGERQHEIVGVVADARYRDLEQPANPTFYVPLDQNDERWPFLSFTAWTEGDAAALGPVFREAMREADPNQPLSRVRTYDELLATAMAARRFNTLLVGDFAVTALLLAAVGTLGRWRFGDVQ